MSQKHQAINYELKLTENLHFDI